MDCWFYFMTFMKRLIVDILQGPPKKGWLTVDWFQHEDVCKLRMDMHTWCMECLGTLGILFHVARESIFAFHFCIQSYEHAFGCSHTYSS